jgi:predicted RNase H-like nuclease (RuvC/YqgF family)
LGRCGLAKKKELDEVYYLGYFKKLYESWEESTHKVMDIWFNSPLMERAVEKSSEFKDYVQGFMEQSLEKRNIPERSEMDKLLNTIDSLEMKIAKLEEKIENLETESEKASPKPKSRTQKVKPKDQKS